MSKSENSTKEVIPVMKKRIDRKMPVNGFQPDSIAHADLGGKRTFDAKEIWLLAISNGLHWEEHREV